MKSKNKTVNNENSPTKKLSSGALLMPISIVLAGLLVVVSILVSARSVMSRQDNLEAKLDRVLANGSLAAANGNSNPTDTTSPFNEETLYTFAASRGVDSDKVKQCTADNKFGEEIKKDLASGQTAGISGTPGFVIGTYNEKGEITKGYRIKGAYPIENFRELLNAVISGNATQFDTKIDKDDPDGSITGSKYIYPVSTTALDDDPFIGDKSKTKVAIVEFSDYECPYCKRYFQEVYSVVKQEFVTNNKAIYVFRDFPLDFHDPVASKEALIGECIRNISGSDEKYFEFHDYVFTNTRANGLGVK